MASKSFQRKLALFIIDALLIGGAQLLALKLITRPDYFNDVVVQRPWWFVLPMMIWLLAVYLAQGYHLEEIVQPWRGLAAMLAASTGAAVVTGFIFFLFPSAPEFSARVLVALLVAVTLLLWLARLVYGRILSASTFKENLLVIGTGESARQLVQVLGERQRAPYRIEAVLNDTGRAEFEIDSVRAIKLAELPELLRQKKIDAVVLGIPNRSDQTLVRAVVALKRRGIKVIALTELLEELTGMVPVQFIGELEMLFQNFGRRSDLARFIEEVSNRALALVLLVVSLPLWPFIILAQQFNSPGPVFVEKSDRVGLAGRTFRFYKFRSMVPNATQVTKTSDGLITQQGDARVTSVGRILRKSHLDELPQLLNILKGDMRFIGPRAEYLQNVQRLEQEIPFYHERHLIKPGLTGWAQVRNVHARATKEDTLEKIQYDLYYLKHRSFALDLAIVLRTAKLIIQGKGTA